MKPKEIVFTRKAGGYETRDGEFICMTMLLEYVTLPKKLPRRLIAVATKNRTPDSFGLRNHCDVVHASCLVGVCAVTQWGLNQLVFDLHEQGYRFAHLEYQ